MGIHLVQINAEIQIKFYENAAKDAYINRY